MTTGGSIGRVFVEVGGDIGPLTKSIDDAVKTMGAADAKLTAYGNRLASSFQGALDPAAKLEKQLVGLGAAGKSAADINEVYRARILESTDVSIRHGQALTPVMEGYRNLAQATSGATDQMWQQRGAATMIENYMGIRLPRAVNTFLAQSQSIGPILSTAFSAAVFVTLGVAVFDLGKKFAESMGWLGKSAEEMKKAADEAERFNQKIATMRRDIENIGFAGKGLLARNLGYAEDDLKNAEKLVIKIGELKKTSQETTMYISPTEQLARPFPTTAAFKAQAELAVMGDVEEATKKASEKLTEAMVAVAKIRAQMADASVRETESINMAVILSGKVGQEAELTRKIKEAEKGIQDALNAKEYERAELLASQKVQLEGQLKLIQETTKEKEKAAKDYLRATQEMITQEGSQLAHYPIMTGISPITADIALGIEKSADAMGAFLSRTDEEVDSMHKLAIETMALPSYVDEAMKDWHRFDPVAEARMKTEEELQKKATEGINKIRDAAGHIFDDLITGSTNVWKDILRTFENVFLAPVRIAFQNLAQALFTGKAPAGGLFAGMFAGGGGGGGSGGSVGGILGAIKNLFHPSATAGTPAFVEGAAAGSWVPAGVAATAGTLPAAGAAHMNQGMSAGASLAVAGSIVGGQIALQDAWKRGGTAGVLEGAGGGAAMGAGIGFMFGGGLGAAIGAGIGAAAGGIIGFFGGGEARRARELAMALQVQSGYMVTSPSAISRTGAFGMSGDVQVETDITGRAIARRDVRPAIVVNFNGDVYGLDDFQTKVNQAVSRGILLGGSQIGDNIAYAAS